MACQGHRHTPSRLPEVYQTPTSCISVRGLLFQPEDILGGIASKHSLQAGVSIILGFSDRILALWGDGFRNVAFLLKKSVQPVKMAKTWLITSRFVVTKDTRTKLHTVFK